jgi:HD domain-containing protein
MRGDFMKDLINKAIKLALEAHEHKKRKAENVPYVIHPIEVGITLAKNGLDDEVIVSGIIHDAVEDEYINLEEVEKIFGSKVKRIVEKVYNADKYLKDEDFRVRKQYTIDYLREEASPEFKFVSCADKLSNVKIMEERYHEIKDELWNKFDESYEDIRWYHQSLIVSLNKLFRYNMYKEYVEIVEKLFGEVPASAFINKNLQTINERFEYNLADNSKWLAEHIITFLGKIIVRFKINTDNEIEKELRDVMNEILIINEKIENSEEWDVSEEQWINILKLFYILRYFFKFHDKWIKDNIGINYLAWFKLYDDKFRSRFR